MTWHRIHGHHQNLAYHFPKSSLGSTPAPVRASSLSAEGCLCQVFVLLFCAVRSSVCLARPLLLLDRPRTDTWGTSRCFFSTVSLLQNFRFHKTFGRSCTFVLEPLLQVHTTILPSQTLASEANRRTYSAKKQHEYLTQATFGAQRGRADRSGCATTGALRKVIG